MTERTTALPAEKEFWGKVPRVTLARASDEEIAAKYDSKVERIVTETKASRENNLTKLLDCGLTAECTLPRPSSRSNRATDRLLL